MTFTFLNIQCSIKGLSFLFLVYPDGWKLPLFIPDAFQTGFPFNPALIFYQDHRIFSTTPVPESFFSVSSNLTFICSLCLWFTFLGLWKESPNRCSSPLEASLRYLT